MMNEKLRNHVNILFAAAPKNAKAEEIKEELLRNLDDKYNDLLANGYDQTAAFHVALSGIGDLDELFKECGGYVPPDTATSSASFAETLNSAKTVVKRTPTPLLILLAIVFLLVAAIAITNPLSFILLVGIALIVYAIICSAMNGKDESFKEYSESIQQPVSASGSPAFTPITQDDITYKRIVAGTLGILLGVFGVHKFYLGFTGTGLVMLLLAVLSLGIVPAIIGFIEGILYLLKTDRDFYRDYEVRRRNWF
jgi:TM2 domain-containing membrane protein YozV